MLTSYVNLVQSNKEHFRMFFLHLIILILDRFVLIRIDPQNLEYQVDWIY
jgi:hypothetical protein